MLTATVRDAAGEPYAKAIETFFFQTWPSAVTPTGASLIDAMTETLVGSSQNRYGPRPTPEVLVSIRDVLRATVAAGEPIRILVPWGSKKTTNDPAAQLDLSEALALKQIRNLGDRLRALWAPGVIFNVQVEDLGGRYLWADDPAALEASDVYVRDFIRLSKLLNFDTNVVGSNSGVRVFTLAESGLGDYASFREMADRLSGPLGTFLRTDDDLVRVNAGAKLRELGWNGDIPDEQVQHYLRSYEKLYPQKTPGERLTTLARYFAQAWARYQLGLKTAYPSWGKDFLILSFVPPVPGNPAALQGRRLFYRTVPLKFARTHLPPWRAKGFLRMDREGATPKLVSWNDPIADTLHACTLTVSDGAWSIPLRADYSVPETE